MMFTFKMPTYVRDGVDAYMLDTHTLDGRRLTLATVALTGLHAIGIQIDEADLVPERKGRGLRKRTACADSSRTLHETTLRLPRYVRANAAAYLGRHPPLTLRHAILAGFVALGIHVRAEDLVPARRRDVLAGPAGR